MAEITAAGYTSLGDKIETDWDYIEVQQSDGTAILRREAVATPGAGQASRTRSGDVITYEMTVTGADVTLPATLARSAIFATAVSTEELSDEVLTSGGQPATAQLNAAEDSVTVTHTVTV